MPAIGDRPTMPLNGNTQSVRGIQGNPLFPGQLITQLESQIEHALLASLPVTVQLIEHRKIREVAILLLIIKPVAHHIFVGTLESYIFKRDVDRSHGQHAVGERLQVKEIRIEEPARRSRSAKRRVSKERFSSS